MARPLNPQMQRTFAVLLAGGSGTRLWPASRQAKPKQFLHLAGDRSMLRETYDRLAGMVEPERVLVVTTRAQTKLVRSELLELPPENVLAEPEARGTGPAIALAAFEIARREKNSIQVVLPADHVIRPRESFQKTLASAVRVAAGDPDALIVFGVRPTFAATGYGWIEAGANEWNEEGTDVFAVKRFVEKPPVARAQEFLERGGFLWNSGMFVWSTQAICAAIEEHLPAAREVAAWPAGEARDAAYRHLKPVSIDVGVLERSEHVRMVAIDYLWSDVGAWDALAALAERDASDNVATGGAAITALDAKGCVVHGGAGALVALIGVEDLVVVHAGDVVLVCPRERAQDVKQLVERLLREAPDFL